MESLLAIDIGGGTQDILLWQKGIPMENCVQMILPSPTVLVAQRIKEAARRKKGIYLTGYLMGGGPSVWAVEEHLERGLPVYATAQAAKTLHDNLDVVNAMGVRIEDPPDGEVETIELSDIDKEALKTAMLLFDIELPERFAVALQDHGESLHGSNRKFRFQHWRSFIEDQGGYLAETAYRDPPPYMTRMKALVEQVPDSIVMDTGMAAIAGSLCDPVVQGFMGKGLIVVNIGNQHTLAAMIQSERIWGIMEHHTGRITPERLKDYLLRFKEGSLSDEEIFSDNGHGCFISSDRPKSASFEFVSVTGPRRYLARDIGAYFASPFGNMMLSGCFGLLRMALQGRGVSWDFNRLEQGTMNIQEV